MHKLGFLKQRLPMLKFDRLEVEDNLKEQKVESTNIEAKPKYSVNEILDRVEEGDVSVLAELGISYTEIETEAGDKKISFKYEGTRYTVNIIETSDVSNDNKEVEKPSNNTKTVKNDDGSYIVYEYDANKTLVKSTKYDKNGELDTIKEYNENGYKAYYYANGIKTTEVDIDNQGRPYHQLDFDNNGNVLRIWDTDWKEDGSEVGVCKTPDGQMISLDVTDTQGRGIYAERYENGKIKEYIETDYLENGVSRQVQKDANGDIYWIIYWSENAEGISAQKSVHKDDKNFAEELKNLANAYDKQLEDISAQFETLSVPVPPSTTDYVNADGSIDEDSYDKAMQKYTDEANAYQNKTSELNSKLSEVQRKLQQVNKQISEIDIATKIKKVEENINNLKNNSGQSDVNVEKLETNFEDITSGLLNMPSTKLGLQERIQEIYIQMLALTIPTPPSVNDYVKSSDGQVDEEAYEAAFNDYERQKDEYNKKISELEAEVSRLKNEIDKTEKEMQKRTAALEQLIALCSR